ncbi:MAG: hypothetical protein H6741_01640 [Alphaproteobacteria bacterium]|nr:hypothetical protein [Alphaproteobacteria bacterium]
MRSELLLALTAPALLLSAIAWSPAAMAQADIPSAKVVMPWNDFQRLYEAGKAPEEKPEPAPRHWSINRATYAGQVVDDGEAALFKVRMQVEIHKEKGWVTVPLAPTSVALKSARIGNADAPIYIDGGWYTLITDRKGVINVDLELAAQVFESDGSHSLSFRMAPSGGTEVSLDVPGDDSLEFTVAQAQMVTDELVGTTRRMKAILPATGNLAISWVRDIEEAPEGEGEVATAEGRVYAEVHSLVGVAEGVLSGHSDINWTIVHQGVDALTVNLPADVAVLDVTGSGIREWNVRREGEAQIIDVDLNFEALGAYRLMIDYERALPEGSTKTTVPRIEPQGVERMKGFVGVAALSTLEVLDEDVKGARRVDVRELPASILGRTDQPVLLGYKYRQGDYSVPLVINQHEDIDVLVTIVDTATAISMVTADGRVMHRMRWHVRNNRRQFLRLQVPEGAEIWSVKVADKAVKPAKDEAGDVLVPLVRSRASGGALAAFAVEVVWVEDGVPPGDDGKGAVDLQLIRTDVPVTYMRWSLYMPWDAKIKTKATESSLRSVEYFSTPVTPDGEYLEQVAQAEMQQSYNAQQRAVEGGVAPVDVAMPVDGQALLFEKLLVLDEDLTVHVEYKGLKD